MFHIFRWRGERKSQDKTTRDSSVNQQYKRRHTRQEYLRASQEIRYRQSLLHARQHWSAADIDRYQVIIKEFL
jgi:hypothetical protein